MTPQSPAGPRLKITNSKSIGELIGSKKIRTERNYTDQG